MLIVSAQATLVSSELIRAAILWHEQWHEGLEEASKFYFGEHNPEGMFFVLEPLHEMVERVGLMLSPRCFRKADVGTDRARKHFARHLSCRALGTTCKQRASIAGASARQRR